MNTTTRWLRVTIDPSEEPFDTLARLLGQVSSVMQDVATMKARAGAYNSAGECGLIARYVEAFADEAEDLIDQRWDGNGSSVTVLP